MKRPWLAAALCLLAPCCTLLYFPDTAAVQTCPDRHNQLLDESQCPQARFPKAVDQDSVEAIFRIRDFGGQIDGTYHWEGNTVTFRPEPQLAPGLRYVLCLQGVYREAGGAECAIDRVVPFYWCTPDDPGGYVLWTSPAPGQTVGRQQELIVAFSRDMDPLTLAPALSVSPDCELQRRWEEGTRRLVLGPQPAWQDLCVYTVRLGTQLRDLAGRPLAREERIVFLVQEDVDPPSILSVRPAFNDALSLFPETGLELADGVGHRDALRVRFSEPMDRSATAQGFSLTPQVAGSLAWLDDQTLVFSPLEGYAAGTSYLLRFQGAADPAGNPLWGACEASFVPDVGEISVAIELVYDGLRIEPGQCSTTAATEIHVSPLYGQYDLLFEFSGGRFDTPAEKAAVQEAIRLSCLFPPGEAGPWAMGYSWTGEDRLSVTFAGLRVSTSEQSYYYLLSLRGGETGVRDDEGGLLAQDVEQLLLSREGGPQP